MVLFQHEGKIFQVPADQWKPVYNQFAEQCKAEHDEVVALGGLHILGTERHEARRIDNQLRGRAGRQGDPGIIAFFPLAGRRFDAHFRRRARQGVDVPPGHDRRRAHRVRPDLAAHRKRAEIGRSAKLRRPQTFVGIRRRDEQAARNHLCEFAAQRSKGKISAIMSSGSRRMWRVSWWTRFARANNIPINGIPRNSLPEMNAQFGIDAKAAGADPGTLTHDAACLMPLLKQ